MFLNRTATIIAPQLLPVMMGVAGPRQRTIDIGQIAPKARSRSPPDVAVNVEDHARPERLYVEGEFFHVRELLSHRALTLQRAHHEQEPAPSCARHLCAGCTRGKGSLDRLIDLRVRNAGGQSPFGLPALVEGCPQGVHVPSPKTARGLAREVPQLVQLREAIRDVRRLLTEDGVRTSRDARIEEQQLVLDLTAHQRGQLELIDDDAIPGAEVDVADPPEGRDVLVLLADWLVAAVDLDGACPVGQLVRGHLPTLICEEGVQKSNGYRGRGTEPGAR